MPANVYECMFLLDTNRVQGDVTAAAQQLHEILERNEAEILASRPWDERRLAYPINNHKKGLYYLTYFRCEGNKIKPIEEECKLKELILRMLVVKIDPKLVEPMLDMARDEHAVALQTVTEDDTFGAGDGGGGRPERRPDRGPRERSEKPDRPGERSSRATAEKEPQPETTG